MSLLALLRLRLSYLNGPEHLAEIERLIARYIEAQSVFVTETEIEESMDWEKK